MTDIAFPIPRTAIERRMIILADTPEEPTKAKYGTINLKYSEILEETDSDLTNKQVKTVRQVVMKDISYWEFEKEMKDKLQYYDIDVTFKLKVPPEDQDKEDDEEA